MTLNNFIKENDFPEVKKVGTLNKIAYYIQKNTKKNQDIGIPFAIKEQNGIFSVCNSDETLKILAIFY